MWVHWDGYMSKCLVDGPIDRFMRDLFPGIHILSSDGVGMPAQNVEYPEDAKYVGTLCTRIPKRNAVLMPLDDHVFEHGLSLDPLPAWEERSPTLFWRGGASGFDVPCLRQKVVATLFGVPHTDCLITRWGGWENGKCIPDAHMTPHRVSLQDHMKHKYIPIIDGNCIASNHMWVFGSGAVPVMITHHDNDYWFRAYIEPWVHYVPVSYDLSDLRKHVEWLVSHDEEAKMIARRALALSRHIFTPEFQREHLRTIKKRMELEGQ